MATVLKRPLSREIEAWARDGVKDSNRSMVVTLSPAGIISLRLKGLQQSYALDLASVWSLAAKRFAAKERAKEFIKKEARVK